VTSRKRAEPGERPAAEDVVLDANILIRAVLGRRVRQILETHCAAARFIAPATAFAEAREHLPGILRKRGIEPAAALDLLTELQFLIDCTDADVYGAFEAIARERLQRRDEHDWPVLPIALALECPIWTEDADFFGAGIATWTTDRLELLLRASPE
jgi:predicted nucleic acid-binding protein